MDIKKTCEKILLYIFPGLPRVLEETMKNSYEQEFRPEIKMKRKYFYKATKKQAPNPKGLSIEGLENMINTIKNVDKKYNEVIVLGLVTNRPVTEENLIEYTTEWTATKNPYIAELQERQFFQRIQEMMPEPPTEKHKGKPRMYLN